MRDSNNKRVLTAGSWLKVREEERVTVAKREEP